MATESSPVPAREGEIIAPGHTYRSVTDQISSIVQTRPTSRSWVLGFAGAFLLVMVLLNTIGYLLLKGVGIWGINVPVGWGFAIVNFVWWIGIGHAGTLISAILLLLQQKWRTSINRFAEAMTLFAVACAGLFPLLHMGRPWFFYWLMPYPNTMELWPQFRSPLVWDVFARQHLRHGVALVLVRRPDSRHGHPARPRHATRSHGSSTASWRWAGAARPRTGTATRRPICCSPAWRRRWWCRCIRWCRFDFAVAIVPGWHTTIFPPYFVAGAIYSGFAMVLTLAIPIRKFYGLEDFITAKHLDNMAKVMLATGLIVAYGYGIEAFMAWYSDNIYEKA